MNNVARWLPVILGAFAIAAAHAAPPGAQDPDWPCMQIKGTGTVGRLSLGRSADRCVSCHLVC